MNMKMLEYAPAWGTSICEARTLTEADHPERFRDNSAHIVMGCGNDHSLKYADYFTIIDKLGYNFKDRKTYSFLGCSNWAFEITQEEWDAILALENSLATEAEEKKRKEKEEWERKHPSPEKVEEMKQQYVDEHGIESYSVETETIYDEGGKTYCHYWAVTVNGKVYRFSERNIFDFGRVINPDYKVSPDMKRKGGLVTRQDDGKLYFETTEKGKGWYLVRPLTEDEETAYEFVKVYGKYGKYSYAAIRM